MALTFENVFAQPARAPRHLMSPEQRAVVGAWGAVQKLCQAHSPYTLHPTLYTLNWGAVKNVTCIL